MSNSNNGELNSVENGGCDSKTESRSRASSAFTLSGGEQPVDVFTSLECSNILNKHSATDGDEQTLSGSYVNSNFVYKGTPEKFQNIVPQEDWSKWDHIPQVSDSSEGACSFYTNTSPAKTADREKSDLNSSTSVVGSPELTNYSRSDRQTIRSVASSISEDTVIHLGKDNAGGRAGKLKSNRMSD